jgi:hypothetical protein
VLFYFLPLAGGLNCPDWSLKDRRKKWKWVTVSVPESTAAGHLLLSVMAAFGLNAYPGLSLKTCCLYSPTPPSSRATMVFQTCPLPTPCHLTAILSSVHFKRREPAGMDWVAVCVLGPQWSKSPWPYLYPSFQGDFRCHLFCAASPNLHSTEYPLSICNLVALCGVLLRGLPAASFNFVTYAWIPTDWEEDLAPPSQSPTKGVLCT